MWPDLVVAYSLHSGKNRKVQTLNEPQVWTVIGVFATALFGMLGFMMTGFIRIMKAEFAVVNTRISGLESRIELLDRDVQFLMKREFGDNTY